MVELRILVGLALLLLSPFAGCVDEPEALANVDTAPADEPDGPSSGVAPGEPGARPRWTHGQWFQFDVRSDNVYVQFETVDRVVVNRADESGYQLGAGNRDLGVIDSHFDDFFVGDLDADLNANLGDPAMFFRMFDWPLTPGKAWTTDLPMDPFSGQADRVTVTATSLPKVKDPRGEGPGFEIHGVSNLGYNFHYTYSPRIQWITEFTKSAPDGRVALHLLLQDAGKDYEGVFHLVTKKTLHERFILWPFFVFEPALGPVPPVDTVTIGEDFTFVQEILAAFTFDVPQNGTQPAVQGAGAFHFQIQYPDNEPRSVSHVGTGNSAKVEITDLEPYAKGLYSVTYSGAGIGGMYAAYHGFHDEVVTFGTQSHVGH